MSGSQGVRQESVLWMCVPCPFWCGLHLLNCNNSHTYAAGAWMKRFQVKITLILLSLFPSCLQFYIQSRFTWRGARLLRPLLQFTLLMMAFYTGLSRVSDHKHHPTDVLAGFVQGALVAYCIVSPHLTQSTLKSLKKIAVSIDQASYTEFGSHYNKPLCIHWDFYVTQKCL